VTTSSSRKAPTRRSPAQPASDARQRILSAALRLFADRGFDATTTKAVSELAGVPSGLVFYYFQRKEALLEALFAGDNVLLEVQRVLADTQGASTEHMMLTLASRLFGWLQQHREQTQIFFKELTLHRAVSEQLARMRADLVSAIAARLDDDCAAGQLSASVDTSIVAQMVTSTAVIGALVQQPGDAQAFVEQLVAIIMRGINASQVK
jgi:AcrR family transcriptional regulator